ncbi:MAG: signal peptidase I [Ruminococcus sp.]|nr:signal peptidase I [Ruminococcus sp.]
MFDKIKRIFGVVLIVILVVVLIYVLVSRISGETPTMFGYSMLRVSSESMEPELNIGDIILVKEVEPQTLAKGDVITYQGLEGPVAGKLITHQIVSEPYEKDGLYYFTTRGIKPGALDDPEIDHTQIHGKVMCKLPLVGTIYDFFSQWYGLACFAAILLIAFSSEIINLISIIRNKDEDIDPEVPKHATAPNYDESFTETIDQETSEVITNLDDEVL